MRRSTIGGYQGPVVVLTRDDVVVAEAACRLRIDPDATVADHWTGRLHRIVPAGALTSGEYRVRLPSGHEGDVIVGPPTPDSDVLPFDGSGVPTP